MLVKVETHGRLFEVVRSKEYFWSFEKQMAALVVQRSKAEEDVIGLLCGKPRTSYSIYEEGRECSDVAFNESICEHS